MNLTVPRWIAGAVLCTLMIWISPTSAQPPEAAAAPIPPAALDPREIHLADLKQLTFGGENAEGYWSPDGKELIFQSAHPPYACDQIFRVSVDGSRPPQLVSTGKGRTTCSYFSYPKPDRILYASTHEGGAECPPVPDRSLGYVWPLYSTYEIYTAKPDGSDLVRLTSNQAYDAEATVCPVDGSILFTSTRDGDIELYRMDADGSNVRRLTESPGYDGGAFFSADCKQIIWRSSRPKPGTELEDYQRLLAQNLVRPSKLELWVAEADGTHARQVTYLGAASFAPFLFPSGKRILFSSNYGDPKGREFDIWAINVDGTGLERITYSADFDGFPMFSPDGKWLAFASNRGGKARGETNLFVARWVEGKGETVPVAADRFGEDVRWLADDAREGRGIGTQGLNAAAEWISARFRALGLEPGNGLDYTQPFEVQAELAVGADTAVSLDGKPLAEADFRPAAFSAEGTLETEVVPVGYGISSPEHGIDDYAGKDVKGKIVLVRRFTPSGPPFDDTKLEQRLSDLRHKAFIARERGAKGLLVVDFPAVTPLPDEAPLPKLVSDQPGDAGLIVASLTRAAGAALFEGQHRASLSVKLDRRMVPVANVIARLPAKKKGGLGGSIVLGAHFDHLGFGGSSSLAPDSKEPHNGADDNASGVAALLEAARALAAHAEGLDRDIWFVAFSAEESGVLGSTHLVRHPVVRFDVGEIVAMINMDMVGRLRGNRLAVLGAESAEEWRSLVPSACESAKLLCDLGGDGYGPSDQTPFYAAGVPVLHLFTGVHDDYHKPSDDSDRINAAGGAQVGALAAELALQLAGRPDRLTYKTAPAPPPQGDVRSYGASLGTIPDYTGAEGKKGVLLAGVRPGGAAEAAGMQRGDLLVELAGHPVGDIYDFMFVMRQHKPGDKVTAVVEREGRRVEMVVTFGVARSRQ